MNKFQPKSADFDIKVRDSFARQTVMQTLGIKLKASMRAQWFYPCLMIRP